jgi:hypothetical protein
MDLGIFCKFGTKINHYKIQIKFEFNRIIGSRVMALDRLKIWIINCFQTISPEWNDIRTHTKWYQVSQRSQQTQSMSQFLLHTPHKDDWSSAFLFLLPLSLSTDNLLLSFSFSFYFSEPWRFTSLWKINKNI